MSKGKIIPEESPEQYPDVEDFGITAVLPLEFSSTPYTQAISTLSCSPPFYMGAQAPDVFCLARLSSYRLLLSWPKQLGRPGPVLMCQSILRVFGVSSNGSVVSPVALVRQSGFRLRRDPH